MSDRLDAIEMLSSDGELEALKTLLGTSYTQWELDTALANAIAYSHVATADFLLELGASFAGLAYEGLYYAVSNNELDALQFAIDKGVDINIQNGMLLNASIEQAINTKDLTILKWLLDNGADRAYIQPNMVKIAREYGTPALTRLVTQK